MKPYVKYSYNAKYRQINFIGSSVSLGIASLGDIMTDAGWHIMDSLTPSTNMYYQSVPYYRDNEHKDLLFPFTAYCGNLVIGYYDPTGEPPAASQPPYYVYWFPAPSSQSATISHTASNIGVIAPGFQGSAFSPGPPWNFGIQVFYYHGGPLFNNWTFTPHSSRGSGGATYGGGYTLRSQEYNDYTVDIDLIQFLQNLFVYVRFGGTAEEYRYKLGQYQWTCLCNPYQLIMVAAGSSVVDDRAKTSTGFLVGLPNIDVTIMSLISYCGVCCGGIYTGGVYTAGDVRLYANTVNSKFRLNNEASLRLFEYIGSGTGLQFPVMQCTSELKVVNGVDELPLINPVYLSLSKNPSIQNSLAKVVGYLWDAFMTSAYIPRGTEVSLDGKTWICMISQNTSFLGQTPSSLCVLKED